MTTLTKNLIDELQARNLVLTKENTSLKLVQEQFQIEKNRINLFSELSPNGVFIISEEGAIIKSNKSGLTLLENKAEDIINLPFSKFLKKKYKEDFNNFLLKVKNNEKENYCTVELETLKDDPIFAYIKASYVLKEKKFLLIATDKTEKEFFKRKLLLNESILKETQRIAHIGSFKYNISTDLIEISEELRMIFGGDEDTPVSIENWVNLVHTEDRNMVQDYLQACIVNHIGFHKEYRIVRLNDSKIRWLDGWAEVIYDKKSKELSMIGIIQDITERKLALKKIQDVETRSHQIFESSKEGILILDAITGQITDANPYLIELIGFNYKELVGKELWEIGVFKNIAASKEAFIELQNKEYIRFEDMPLETKAGCTIDVEFVSNVYLIDAHKVILCHIRDISDRKKADRALQESSQLYYAMFENNQAPQLLIHPVSGKIIDVNSAAAGFYGYSLEEFKKMNIADISTFSSNQILEEMEKFALQGPSYFEFVHRLASGETCDIEIYTSPLSINGEDLLISTINNISKRKLEEERLVELNNQLKEVDVLKSQFISTVSHEFRTPLAGILSSVQLLQFYDNTADQYKKEKLFKQIFDAVQQTKALLDDVSLIDEEQNSKSFFRPKDILLLPLIDEIIEENLSVFETKQKVLINTALNISNYYMDAIMIRHIFNNIISNAIKYSTEDVEIHLEEAEKKYIKFKIIDTGIGIPKKEMKYLLDPFYRASNSGTAKGTGFGLSIVKRFVHLHKGKMHIASIVNKGTTITIQLPYKKPANII